MWPSAGCRFYMRQFFDADLRKYVIYSRVHLGDLIGQGFWNWKIWEKGFFGSSSQDRTRIAGVTARCPYHYTK